MPELGPQLAGLPLEPVLAAELLVVVQLPPLEQVDPPQLFVLPLPEQFVLLPLFQQLLELSAVLKHLALLGPFGLLPLSVAPRPIFFVILFFWPPLAAQLY